MDFIIVAVAAAIAATTPPASIDPAAAAAAAPLSAPAIGFKVYRDATSCERAAGGLVAPAGTRLSRFRWSGQRMRWVLRCPGLGWGGDHGWQVACRCG